MHPVIAIALVFAGCLSNVVFLELIVTVHPSSANIITFAQFVFITLEGFIFTSRLGSKQPLIPFWSHTKMMLLYVINVIFQTILLQLHIDIPLQQLLRSGTLIANLILGVLLLKRSYSLSEYLSIVMITLGLGIATFASSYNTKSKKDKDEQNEPHCVTTWLIGIALLACALNVSALLGIYQEIIYEQHGKHPVEALYYSHMLPMPAFIFLGKDINNHITLFNASEPITLTAGITLPKMWVYLAGNVLSHYICIMGVFLLSAECTSLTVNLILTLRKFISLLFSIIYFNNSFTIYHWFGTILIFSGTLLFADVFSVSRILDVSEYRICAVTAKPRLKRD